MGLLPDDIQEQVRQSKRVCVFTGAGVSAESGIPTFRDAGGPRQSVGGLPRSVGALWENHRPEDLVTASAFVHDPVPVWRWHAWLQGVCHSAEPNPAHKSIAAMDAFYPDFLVITQNIDTLHERAGTKRMVKLHGDIMETRCLRKRHIVTLDSPFDKDSITSSETLPRCPRCGEPCRPNVIWFGEMLPEKPLITGRRFAASSDLFFIVGTSGVVSGGYGFTELARYAGALVIEVNPQESALTHLAHYTIRLPAAEALPRIRPV